MKTEPGEINYADALTSEDRELIERMHQAAENPPNENIAVPRQEQHVEEPRTQTMHSSDPDQDEVDERWIAAALDPSLDYFDATAIIQALGRKVRKQDATINRLANILEGFARRQIKMNTLVVELQGEVRKLQAEKKSSIIRLN